MENVSNLTRIRIKFAKEGSLRYIGHLDLAKMFERILRRAQVGLTYSQGFNARPKIQLAAPLPLGFTSDAELLDIWLDAAVPLAELPTRLMAVSPPGLRILSAEAVPLRGPALQTLTDTAIYRITFVTAVSDLYNRVADLLACTHISRTRRDKPYDLRPLIVDLRVDDAGTLWAELVLGNATGRPDELLEALGLAPENAAIHRAQIKLRAEAAAPMQDSPAGDDEAGAEDDIE